MQFPSFTARTNGVSNPSRSPSFRLSVSVQAQKSAFAFGVLPYLYAFHRSTGNSLFLYHTQVSQFLLLVFSEAERFNNKLAKPPTDALRPINPDNACIPRITAAAGTQLADAYSHDTVRTSSHGKGVYSPRAFILHAVLLRQACAHCEKFPTAASRGSLGRVSVPV